MELDAFDADAFLRDHWQKKPLLIRNPWSGWRNPLDPDELAGLACEDGVESRLVRHKRSGLKVEQGPFGAARFAKLGKVPWTLLVQAVDQSVPEVAALIDPFRFIPNWRIDDVMVSYATDGGGVGAHFDQYDVFLVQGLGQRHWQIGALCDAQTKLLPHDDLRLLAKFEPSDEWVLNPGDILYLPPRVAHNGVAVGDDCMTYSIGFRAPARSELIAHYCDHLLANLQEDDRYIDPDLVPQANSGEITVSALHRLRGMITDSLTDDAAFARWFGSYSSIPKYPDVDWQPDDPLTADDLRTRLTTGAKLHRNPASRFAFVREDSEAVTMFVDGEAYDCTGAAASLVEMLCGRAGIQIPGDLASDDLSVALILNLYGRGNLNFG